MKIAAIIPGLPEPANRGTFKRYRAMIKALSRIGEVHCVCLADEEITIEGRHAFSRYTHRTEIVRVQLQPWKTLWLQIRDHLPPNVRHWYDPSTQNQINAFFANETYDYVFLGDLVSIPYAKAAGLNRFPVFIDRARVDFAYQKQKLTHSTASMFQRAKELIRIAKTKRFERKISKVITGTIVCSASDEFQLKNNINKNMRIQTIVNGIDLIEFKDCGELPNNKAIMIPGAMDYEPNVEGTIWFTKHVWPTVRKSIPDAELYIVGRNPVDRIKALALDRQVKVTGHVTSMIPYYKNAQVVCAPIHIGGGSRLKVVEAWAVGRPLVATSMAVDGLQATHEKDCLLSDDPGQMASDIIASMDTAQGNNLRRQGLQTAKRYSWQHVTKPLVNFLRQQ